MKRPSIFQYKNCRKIGHVSKNCKLSFRCVKCAGYHSLGKCTVPRNSEKNALKCSNCNQTGQPASCKGCPYIKFALNFKKELATNRNQHTQQKLAKISKNYQCICIICTSSPLLFGDYSTLPTIIPFYASWLPTSPIFIQHYASTGFYFSAVAFIIKLLLRGILPISERSLTPTGRTYFWSTRRKISRNTPSLGKPINKPTYQLFFGPIQ